jgi:hypothetical protein
LVELQRRTGGIDGQRIAATVDRGAARHQGDRLGRPATILQTGRIEQRVDTHLITVYATDNAAGGSVLDDVVPGVSDRI